MRKIVVILTILLITHSLYAKRSLRSAIVDHLSFLGYECEGKSGKIVANHPTKPGFDIQTSNNGILFRAYFPHTEAAINKLGDYLALVNAMNRSSTLITFSVDGDYDLVLEAWYPLPYMKRSFATFVSAWEMDFMQSFMQRGAELKEFLQ